VDKYNNIRFDVKALPNNVGIFSDKIVVGWYNRLSSNPYIER
jgi:hypothetical protein